ncbi:TPA: ribonucleotide reductase subunit alpha [Stenotrophomonas maltophilia]|nr:ribonucleotide reductase subunit alpha [Stenotrophomonas maltophilia]HDS1024333.1 ribonucleotide reductase subunit alpha [Stenotrophomonas maltophilia]HDS1028805.1 ribonucleotide reductase subunit alpha [Stenotrophomonas maltophilia]HDS1035389.1 ribonucleotide reductase subunit alpha [Stenotrophomonas maltophilia]
MMMNDFQQLLHAATEQAEPQRLLFVFVRADLPESPTGDQRERHDRREGGTLSPVLCVDKLPGEVPSFQALASESTHTGIEWDLVFVAAMDGRAGFAPNSDEAARPLQLMVNAIHDGQIGRFAAFDRSGEPVQFY